jgi:hypothetical protein
MKAGPRKWCTFETLCPRRLQVDKQPLQVADGVRAGLIMKSLAVAELGYVSSACAQSDVNASWPFVDRIAALLRWRSICVGQSNRSTKPVAQWNAPQLRAIKLARNGHVKSVRSTEPT